MSDNTDSFSTAAEILCDELRETVSAMPEGKKATIQEIRLRANRPLAFTDGSSTFFSDSGGRIIYSYSDKVFMVTQRHIYDTFRRLCGYSVYSCENEIRNGFITIRGGHRVGLCGTAVCPEGRITTVNDVTSLNVRISRQITGVSRELISRLYPFHGGILIIGSPSSGKTTLLRDLARSLSLGIGCRIMRTAVIDERGEIAGTYHGIHANDIGICDILDGYPKGEGIIHAVRALSPQVIICDELGDKKDASGVSQGFNAGALVVASVHAGSFEELCRRSFARELIDSGAFRTAVVLESSDRPCRIKEIISIGEKNVA